MSDFQEWVLRFPDPRRAQLALLANDGDPLLRALCTRATGEKGVGPALQEAFLSICHGPQREPYLRVLRRAEQGDYPPDALRALLLQSEGKRLWRQDLRDLIERRLGVYPQARIYLLPDSLYRAAAAEIGFPLAFYRPDTIYLQKNLSDSVLLHELLHSAQYQTGGAVLPPSSEREAVALEVLEAVTEEWVARNSDGRLYPEIRQRLLRLCPDLDIESVVLLRPESILDLLDEKVGGDFMSLWKSASLAEEKILL